MATSTTPVRQARPNVSDMTTARSTPRSSAGSGADPVGRAVGIAGEENDPVAGHIGTIDAGIGADESVAGDGDDHVPSPPNDRRLPQTPPRFGSPRRSRPGPCAPSALETTLWVTTRMSPSRGSQR